MAIHLEGITVCPSCKKTVWVSSPHSCFDLDALDRLRAAERAVIESAVAFCDAPIEHNTQERDVLDDAVASLRTITEGET